MASCSGAANSSKGALVDDLKSLSSCRLIEVLKVLVSKDVGKEKEDRLLPKLKTKSRTWMLTKDGEGMGMPASAVMDLKVKKNMSYAKLPFSMNLTRVPRVLFCGMQFHSGSKSITFAAVQPHHTQQGGHETMYMHVGLEDGYNKETCLSLELFRMLMEYVNTHVRIICLYTPSDVQLFNSFFQLNPKSVNFDVRFIGHHLEPVIRGWNKYATLSELLRIEAEKSDDAGGPLKHCRHHFDLADKDEDVLVKSLRLSLTNAKTMFLLYDRNRRALNTIVSFPLSFDA